MDTPQQPPEARLIEAAQKSAMPPVSQRKVAEAAGISESRWRQIIKGYQATRGGPVPVIAPHDTLARMAIAVGVSAEQMASAGRDDAAEAMRTILASGSRSDIELAEVSTDRLLAEIRRRIEDSDIAPSVRPWRRTESDQVRGRMARDKAREAGKRLTSVRDQTAGTPPDDTPNQQILDAIHGAIEATQLEHNEMVVNAVPADWADRHLAPILAERIRERLPVTEPIEIDGDEGAKIIADLDEQCASWLSISTRAFGTVLKALDTDDPEARHAVSSMIEGLTQTLESTLAFMVSAYRLSGETADFVDRYLVPMALLRLRLHTILEQRDQGLLAKARAATFASRADARQSGFDLAARDRRPGIAPDDDGGVDIGEHPDPEGPEGGA